MKSAALSISNNISEGAARKTKKHKNHFFTTTRSSTVEVANYLTATIVLKFIKKEEIATLVAALTEVFKLISGLIGSNER